MFTVPKAQKKTILDQNTFLGVDFTNEPGNVAQNKSPYAENMIRDVPGKVRKCMGWHTVKTCTGKINGCFKRKGDTDSLIHSGAMIYKGETSLYTSANNEISRAFQVGDKLYILDGLAILVYDGITVQKVSDNAYVPTLTIAKSASGGGTDYEGLNLLSPKFKESFLGVAGDTIFQMSFGSLDSVDKVEILNSSGVWVTKTAGTDYSVNLTAGTVTFVTSPGASPVSGEDNVRITASRTVSGYADRINKCRIGILFGVNGASDRLFVSGNPDYINYDWFSAQDDPSYFSDTNYSVIGQASSAIMGYSLINNHLATHKDEKETERNIVVREGVLVTSDSGSKPAFPIVNSLQGPGAVAHFSFGYLSSEPVFLTNLGVYAVTASDVSGDRYSQLRSFFVNGKLLVENNLENAMCISHNDMYWVFINGVAYILDGLQSIPTDKSAPYSTRQYAGFYRTNVPVRVAWEENGKLYFGTESGKICEFYSDKDEPSSYNDDGEAISCCWTTPDFAGSVFYKNKSFRYLSVKLSSAIATSIKMSCMRKGIWSLLREESLSARYLSFSHVIFSKFSFSCDTTNKVLSVKTKIKRTDKTRYKFENSEKNEPFGLMEYAIEYVQSGNYKG